MERRGMNNSAYARSMAHRKAASCVTRRLGMDARSYVVEYTNMMDISKKYPSQVLDYHEQLGIDTKVPLGNMSICRLDEGYLMSIRQFNYRLNPGEKKGHLFGDFFSDRGYVFVIVDKDFNFVRKICCSGIEMLEDIRILRFGDVVDEIQASATDISYGRKHYRIVSAEILLDRSHDSMKICEKTTFPVPHEKNYMPVEDGKGVFVSDMLLNCLNVVSTSDPSKKRLQRCRGLAQYSGSSQLMMYKDGYCALIHRRYGHVYHNAFAFFDKALTNCRISDEFTVFRDISPVNFCCGMVIEGDVAIIPFCIHDCDTRLFRLPLQDFALTARWRDIDP